MKLFHFIKVNNREQCLSIFLSFYYIITMVIEMDYILIKDLNIKYEIIHMKKKNVSFRYVDDILVIRVPLSMSTKDVLKVLKENEDLIYKKLLISNPSKKEKLQFLIGDEIKVLENPYLIKESKKRFIDKNTFYVRNEHVFDDVLYLAASLLFGYVKTRTNEYFESMYSHGICPKINLKFIKGYYGKYSKTKHEIIYNVTLAFLDKELIDYVIVHELCHIKYLNHQKEFYDFLKVFLPNYKCLEKRLKTEGKVK